MIANLTPPLPGEYLPYTLDYISLVPDDGLLLEHLETGAAAFEALVLLLPPERLVTPHAPGEWTVQDVVQHVIDTERVLSYRVLCIARGEKTALPAFEQEDYAPMALANRRQMADLLSEHSAVRASTLALLRSLPDDAWTRVGIASNHALSVRAAAYIIAGHELYHLNSIRTNYA